MLRVKREEGRDSGSEGRRPWFAGDLFLLVPLEQRSIPMYSYPCQVLIPAKRLNVVLRVSPLLFCKANIPT